ncbi:hypothetical protein ACI798_02060 [Geodermatophilus sp. SYSU D01045]
MESTSSNRRNWSLDEYVVVAELYLRRLNTSNAHNPEVIELASLINRTPAAVSYRLGNFHSTVSGAGFKPVRGEALAVFTAMRQSPVECERLAREARGRLAAGLPSAPIQIGPSAAAIVDVERMATTETETSLSAKTQRIIRKEAQLVSRYTKWLDPAGDRLRGVLIPCGPVTLRADLYDQKRNLLIEAKAEASRDMIRYAIGQLLDYQQKLDFGPDLAVLLPTPPAADLASLLSDLRITVIYEDQGRFIDPLA